MTEAFVVNQGSAESHLSSPGVHAWETEMRNSRSLLIGGFGIVCF